MKTLGVLCHVTSLRNEYGIGDFGRSSLDFVDLLAKNNIKIWQVLPLTETDEYNCPYRSMCYFAYDEMFISPDDLLDRKLIKENDLAELKKVARGKKTNYEVVKREKRRILDLAFENINDELKMQVENALKKDKDLCSFAYFKTLKEQFETEDWRDISKELTNKKSKKYIDFFEKNRQKILKYAFIQYILNQEWQGVLKFARQKGVSILGDVPIYPDPNSFDVFSNPKAFLLDNNLKPKVFGGVSGDQFNQNGQNWKTCVYDWQYLQKSQYKFLIKKIKTLLSQYHLLRLDHFIGYVKHFEIDLKGNGKWIKNNSQDFFEILKDKTNLSKIYVEDLGKVDGQVKRIKGGYNFKGMAVLQFAIDSDCYFPNKVGENSVYYLGTHDNNTYIGFLRELERDKKKQFLKYLGIKTKNNKKILKLSIQKMVESKSDTIILQMQDILMQNQKYRMNQPGRASGNWEYKLPKSFERKFAKNLKLFLEEK